tara:strand:- start:2212 stop:2763 length:552 start_codon:yes stop_codon:yes gene_type:complete
MNKSESIIELSKALNKFQAECSGAKKSANNPFFKSKYANLEEVITCAKEPLMTNGLSVSQFPTASEGKCGVETILMHTSGEWISSVLLLACTKQDPQAYGSAITYARRYAYQSVLGIPSEDDDANAATKQKSTAVKKPANTATEAALQLKITQTDDGDKLRALWNHPAITTKLRELIKSKAPK